MNVLAVGLNKLVTIAYEAKLSVVSFDLYLGVNNDLLTGEVPLDTGEDVVH